MKKSIFGLILISLLLSKCDCHNHDHDDCEDEEVFGEEVYNVELTPLQTTYVVGDTINVSATINALLDLDTGGQLDHSNQPISFQLQILRIQPDNNSTTAGIQEFIHTGLNGNSTEGTNDLSIVKAKNICNDTSCNIEFGLIPQEQGVFSIIILGLGLTLDPCENYNLDGRFNVIDNNFAICQSINTNAIDLLGLGPKTSAAGQEFMYFFAVTN